MEIIRKLRQVSVIYEIWKDDVASISEKLGQILDFDTKTSFNEYINNFSDAETIRRFGGDITEKARENGCPDFIDFISIQFYFNLPSIIHVRLNFFINSEEDYRSICYKIWDWCDIFLKDSSYDVDFVEMEKYKFSPGFSIDYKGPSYINPTIIANEIYQLGSDTFVDDISYFVYSHLNINSNNREIDHKVQGFCFDNPYDDQIDIFPMSFFSLFSIIYSIRILNFKLRNEIFAVRKANKEEDKITKLAEYVKYNDRYRIIVREYDESKKAFLRDFSDLILYPNYSKKDAQSNLLKYTIDLLEHEINLIEIHSADNHKYITEIFSLNGIKFNNQIQKYIYRATIFGVIFSLFALMVALLSTFEDLKNNIITVFKWISNL